MASQLEYIHKKFDTTLFVHKKFDQCSQKRKRSDDIATNDLHVYSNNKENLNNPAKNITLLDLTIEQPAKRLQTITIFRPWLDNQSKNSENIKNIKRNVKQIPLQVPQQSKLKEIHETISYHPSKARIHPPQQRTAIEQMRRDRNTKASLIHRHIARAENATLERQFLQYQQQNYKLMEEQVRANLYLKYLLQLNQATQFSQQIPLQPTQRIPLQTGNNLYNQSYVGGWYMRQFRNF